MIDVIFHPATIAAVFTAIGAIALKVLEKWLNKSADARSERQQFLDEVRALNVRIDELELEISQFRKRAYQAEEEAALLRMYMIENGVLPPQRPTSK